MKSAVWALVCFGIVLFSSCTSRNGIFGTEAQLNAAETLTEAWSSRPFWEGAAVEVLSRQFLAQSVKISLTAPGTSWETILLLFAPDPSDLKAWRLLRPGVHWAWVDASGTNTPIPDALRLVLDRDQGWEKLGEAGGLLAQKRGIQTAVALVGPETPSHRRDSLLRGWSVTRSDDSLSFVEIPSSESDPETALRRIPPSTNCVFLLFGPPTADTVFRLPRNVVRLGEFIRPQDMTDWDASIVPDGMSTYEQIVDGKIWAKEETLVMPWKTVFSSR